MDMREAIFGRAGALQGFPGQTMPDATPDILARAERIAAGVISFYGGEEVRIGLRDIDWAGSHVNHREWPPHLNRFYHLLPLASAYWATRDERFAQAARSYVEDWMCHHVGYETADHFMPGDRSLDMSMRIGTSQAAGWSGTLHAFLHSPSFDDVFLKAVVDSLSTQVTFLSTHLTPWGNWRVSELDALVFTSLRFPFMRNASDLLVRGIRGMRSALATQFLADGVHIERCPGYHDWMARVLASYHDLARRFPEADARVDGDMVIRAFDYAAHDELFGVNDSRAPHRDPDPLIHLRDREEVLRRAFAGNEIPADPPLEQVFPQAGHVFLRSSWRPGADYIAFDAGTWGSDHDHLSRLSFVFRSGGRELIADPGILNYEMSDPFGPYGKSTRAHSTLNLDGWNQCEADARLLRTEFTVDTALIHAKYQGGYWEGEYTWGFENGRGAGVFGAHERLLFWIRGAYLLALDAVEADSGAAIHNCWQMGPMDSWAMDPNTLRWWSRNSDINILVQHIPFAVETEMECFEGSREPIRGWVGLHGNDAIPAPLVEFRYPTGVRGGSLSAVLLASFSGATPPAYRAKRTSQRSWGRLRHIEMILPNGATDLIAWAKDLSSPLDNGTPVVSDAPFVWLRRDASGRPAKGFLLDGSHLEWERRPLHDGPRRESRLLVFD